MHALLFHWVRIIAWSVCTMAVGILAQPGFAQAPTIRTTALDDNTDSIAVVIGNKLYKNGVVAVEYAHNDAEGMKSWLINAMGFKEPNIIFAKDATLADFFQIFGVPGSSGGDLLNRVKLK